jgi:hypothetical protein
VPQLGQNLGIDIQPPMKRLIRGGASPRDAEQTARDEIDDKFPLVLFVLGGRKSDANGYSTVKRALLSEKAVVSQMVLTKCVRACPSFRVPLPCLFRFFLFLWRSFSL